ncbi:hypothetical protein Dsin_029075 [Dipteronia sinensis]|uniref:No apical meristem-associated C-terminal domain-containing protein n=1 Tax=Dipteronia sinensis TaxID=43782 RepID=A0AAD9ZS52_9ROSI|nr:hypothetical protein Dsin_029075 [Dipteronia sinensis]
MNPENISEPRDKRSLQCRMQTSEADTITRAKILLTQDNNYKKGFKLDHLWPIIKEMQKFADNDTATSAFRRQSGDAAGLEEIFAGKRRWRRGRCRVGDCLISDYNVAWVVHGLYELQRRKATSHAKFVFKRKCAYLDAKFSSSELEVMKLFVSLSCMVFVFVYRVNFHVFCESVVDIHVCEGFPVSNPKTNSNSKFGGRKTVEERERSAKGSKRDVRWLFVKTTPSPRWRVAILGKPPLYPHGVHAPPRGAEVARKLLPRGVIVTSWTGSRQSGSLGLREVFTFMASSVENEPTNLEDQKMKDLIQENERISRMNMTLNRELEEIHELGLNEINTRVVQ